MITSEDHFLWRSHKVTSKEKKFGPTNLPVVRYLVAIHVVYQSIICAVFGLEILLVCLHATKLVTNVIWSTSLVDFYSLEKYKYSQSQMVN